MDAGKDCKNNQPGDEVLECAMRHCEIGELVIVRVSILGEDRQ
jgi:hypothetical protein